MLTIFKLLNTFIAIVNLLQNLYNYYRLKYKLKTNLIKKKSKIKLFVQDCYISNTLIYTFGITSSL